VDSCQVHPRLHVLVLLGRAGSYSLVCSLSIHWACGRRMRMRPMHAHASHADYAQLQCGPAHTRSASELYHECCHGSVLVQAVRAGRQELRARLAMKRGQGNILLQSCAEAECPQCQLQAVPKIMAVCLDAASTSAESAKRHGQKKCASGESNSALLLSLRVKWKANILPLD